MDSWIILSLTYGLLCGTSDIVKKEALKQNNVSNVLLLFNLICLVLIVPTVTTFYLSIKNFMLILLKSFCVFLGWLLGFKSITLVPISLYGILMLSKILFSTLLGAIFLNESLSGLKILGMIIIIAGITLSNLNFKTSKSKNQKVKIKHVLLTLSASLIISISVFLDKVILTEIQTQTLQFYYVILIVIFYLMFMLKTKTKVEFCAIKTNIFIPTLSAISFLADKCHFVAASNPNASVILMTLLRQSSLIVSVFVGGLIYKEKHLILKLFSCIIVIIGLILTII